MALKGNYMCHVTSFRLKYSPTAQSMCRRGQLYTFITYVSQSNTNTHIDRIYLSVTSSHITCVPLPNKETNTLTFMGNITHPEETPGCGSESKRHYKSAGSPPTPTPQQLLPREPEVTSIQLVATGYNSPHCPTFTLLLS